MLIAKEETPYFQVHDGNYHVFIINILIKKCVNINYVMIYFLI